MSCYINDGTEHLQCILEHLHTGPGVWKVCIDASMLVTFHLNTTTGTTNAMVRVYFVEPPPSPPKWFLRTWKQMAVAGTLTLAFLSASKHQHYAK